LRNIIGVMKAKSPMTEVRTYDKCVGRISEVGNKESPKSTFSRRGGAANHDRDEWRILGGGLPWILELQETMDVRQMKFETVFSLIHGRRNGSKVVSRRVLCLGFSGKQLGD
jgi:hypothetical protein